MLQQIRKVATSKVAGIVIFVPLVISFGVWGIADIFKGGTDTSVATVGGTTISSEFFQREYNNTLRSQAGPNGAPLSSDVARKAGLPDKLLQSLIDRTALSNAADSYKLQVSDAAVAAEIKGARGFAGQLGTFDRNIFLQVLQQRGYTEQEFIELVRSDIARDQMIGAAGAGFTLPLQYTQTLFSFLNEVRAADFVIVPASAVGPIAPPSDAVLQAYVKANAARFSTPEYREVDYASVTPDDLAAQIKVTDAQLQQQYELRKSDPRSGYDVPETRTVEQITFQDEKSADAASAKIASGASFADIAKANGGAPVSLGSVSKDDLGTRGAAVFALAENGVTPPQKNLTGWVLLHVTKITPGIHKSFADVKEDIRKDVATQLASAKIGDMANAYTDANSGGLSLQEAGKKVGMKTAHIAAVDANGLAPDGSKTALADQPEVLKQVFAAEVGDEGDPFNTKSGAMYVLKVDGQTPPKLKALDAIRADATAAWTAQERERLLAAKAQALAATANAQHNLSAAAAAAGSPIVSSGLLHRPTEPGASENPALPTPLVGRLFEVPGGTAVSGPSENGDSYVVARVTGVGHTPIPMASLQFLQGSQQLSQQGAQDFAPLMAGAARSRQGVTINRQNVDRVTGESS